MSTPLFDEILFDDFSDDSPGAGCDTGSYWNGEECVVIPDGMDAPWACAPGYTFDMDLLACVACVGSILAPAVPIAPTIAAFECGDTSLAVTVTWPLETTTHDAADSLELQRRRNGGEWVTVNSPEGGAAGTTGEYSDPNIATPHNYQYRVRAVNAAGPSEWSTVSAIADLASASLSIAWTSPAADSNLKDITELQVTLTDATESENPECDDEPVVIETFFNDDAIALEWTLISGTWRNGVYQAFWDAREFGAGAQSLSVHANDNGGCKARATRAFILLGIFDPLTVCWWSKKLPTAALEALWPREDSEGEARAYKRITPSLIAPVRAVDDADNYVYNLYANVPGDSTTLGDYQVLADKRHSIFLEAEQTFRVVLCREPLLQRNTYALGDGALHAVRLHLYDSDGDKLAILAQGPNKVLSFDGSEVSLVVDLSSFTNHTPVDLAFLDNRFYVVMQPNEGAPASALPHIRVIDLDDTDRPYRVLPDEDNSPLTAIAVFDSKLWIAATTGEGEATIYAFDASNMTQPVEVATLPPVIRFDTRSGASEVLRAACEGGEVYEITEDGAELVHATGADDALALFADGAMIYAGTGESGKLFTNRGGDWHEEKDFADWTRVLALAAYRTSAHAGGDSAFLYQRRGGVWIQVDELDDVSSINDMVEFGDALVVATSNGGSQAFLHTRKVSSKKGVIAREVPQIAFGLELTS